MKISELQRSLYVTSALYCGPLELHSKFNIRGRLKKKNIKKLTNVSLYVCMSAENSKMLVFVCFFMFFPIVA